MAETLDPITITVTRSMRVIDALETLNRTGMGLLLLVDATGALERTVTDGDIRRLLLGGARVEATLNELGSQPPVTLQSGWTRRAAHLLMNQHGIHHIPLVDATGHVSAVIDRRAVDEVIYLSSPHMGDSEREFIDDAFRTNWIAPLGPNVDQFESEFAEMLGMPHAAALSSGTAALHLALCILGVGTGDLVFCSSLTFAASANPIAYQGAVPIFVDSDASSWNMSPEALEDAFAWAVAEGRMPKAVIAVDIYGQSADMDRIMSICRRHHVPVVEDAAESLGARYKDRASGTFGDMSIFSFNGNKIITTSGGGMLVSRNPEYVRRARFLATQARDSARHYEHSVIGFNYRMSNILAGVGRGQLRMLPDRVESRRRVFRHYQEALAGIDGVSWMPEPAWSRSSRWLSVATIDPIRCGRTTSDVIDALAAEFIEARHVWKPMHLQPVFAGSRYFSHPGGSVSDALFRDGICLPSGSNMTDAQMDRVVEEVRRALVR